MTALADINQRAHAALRRELGPVDYARFLQQFEIGRGDFTAERQCLPEDSAEAIHARTAKAKEQGLLPVPAKARVLPLD
jgi:hypothetical protein